MAGPGTTPMSDLKAIRQRIWRLGSIHDRGEKSRHDEAEMGKDGDRGEKEERGGERTEVNAEGTEDGNGKPGSSCRSRCTVATLDDRPGSDSAHPQ